MTPKSISGSNFWNEIRQAAVASATSTAHFNDGDIQYVATFGLEMGIIRRTAEEFFADTVRNQIASQNYKVVINGNQWDATRSGIADALFGNDPVESGETTPLGHIISGGLVVGGSPEPNRFFLSFNGLPSPPQNFTSTITVGQGNPPLQIAGMGGLGPLIIGRLPFGHGNLYRAGVPTGAPPMGEPGPTFRPFLVQRNNNTFVAMASRGAQVGKVALAINRFEDIVVLIVQPDNAPTGTTLEGLRDKLSAVGTDDAVFFDGSDSAMLVLNGAFHVAQAESKDELTTIGLGFR